MNLYTVINRGQYDSIIIRRYTSQIPWPIEWGLLEACGSANSGRGYTEYKCLNGLDKALKVLDRAGWERVMPDELPEPTIPEAVLAHEARRQGRLEAVEEMKKICKTAEGLVGDGNTQYEQGWRRGIEYCIDKIVEEV